VPEVDINDLGSIGSVADIPSYMLPPEAWSVALNMRVVDGGLESLAGWEQVFGTLPAGNDSFTKVLLDFPGADASTTITDTNAGGSPHTWTAAGNAQIDTAQSKFGGSSLFLDGTGDFISTPDSADMESGSSDFAMECFFNRSDGANFRALAGRSDAGFTAAGSAFIYRFGAGNVIEFRLSNGSGVSIVTGTTVFTNVINPGFHHTRVVRIGNILRLFVDGVQEGGDVAFTGSVNNTALPFCVGSRNATPDDAFFGWIDAFRFSIGTSREATTFTPPTREFMTVAQVTPHFIFPVVTQSSIFWVYTSLTKAFVFDGTSHFDITRAVGGDYTANTTADWNGTLLGGILILNNGSDVPQFWAVASPTQKLANLTNWPTTHRAKVVRAFGPHLVAINITISGTIFPHRVLWSHPADPGSVPSSWDVTDTTKDTGHKELPDVQSGVLLDALPLGSTMFLYKESSVWKMRFIGGRFIFDFGESAWLSTIGLLAPRCVCLTGDGVRHVFASQDDILWHNGNNVESILNQRQKKRLFNEIDTVNYTNSFIFANPNNSEIWFCYPTDGAEQPTRALIMNYGGGQRWSITEADGITFRNAAIGQIENPSDEDWEANENLWDDDDGPWSELQRRRVILAGTDSSKFFNMDRGVTRDGLTFITTLSREGLSIIGRKRNGDWIVDHQQMKFFKRLWLKVQGGPINVRFGGQQTVDGPVAFGATVSFNPLTMVTADPGPVSGRAVGIEFSTTGSTSWRIDGYKIDLEAMGNF